MKACMGGWCARRDQCPHHTAEGEPAERLCLPGRDGVQMVWASPFRQVTRDIFQNEDMKEAA